MMMEPEHVQRQRSEGSCCYCFESLLGSVFTLEATLRNMHRAMRAEAR